MGMGRSRSRITLLRASYALLLVLIAAPAYTQGIAAGTLVIHVTGARNVKGHLLVSVWPGPQGFPSSPVRIIGPQKVGLDGASLSASATFRDLPAGDYSVTVMHDENDNGKMDKNLLGIPKEGFGVSNDPKKKLHMPTFDETKFHCDGSARSIDITLKYF